MEGTIPGRHTRVGKLTNIHTKPGFPSYDRGRLAQTVKEEKDISNESNSLGLRQNKTREDIGIHNL